MALGRFHIPAWCEQLFLSEVCYHLFMSLDDLSTDAGMAFRYILTYKRDHDGNSPSYREIAEVIGVRFDRVGMLLDELENAGLIQQRRRGSIKRSIEVVGGSWVWNPTSAL